MKAKLKIAVLMGGKSPEHEVSVAGGLEVIRNLNKNKYEIIPVLISRDGQKLNLIPKNKLQKLYDPISFKVRETYMIKASDNEIENINQIAKKIDVAFIVMHGPFGEDGTVQGMLDMAGVAYTGSGVLASSLGMDKIMFRKILKSANIPTPKFITVKKGERIGNISLLLGKPPYFVKPHNQGSSLGVSRIERMTDIKDALQLAFKYSEIAIIDKLIEGLEITCGVLGNSRLIALPVIEIHSLKGKYFDYNSKYLESGADEVVPANISAKLTGRVQELAIKVYKEIGCKGFARVDMILKDGKYPYVLEINTIPGLTSMSLFPKAAASAGISYTKLLDKIINYAIEEH